MYEYDSDLSIETILLQQMLVIGQLATRIYFSPRSEWQTNALNMAYAVDFYESLAYPYLSDTYRKNVRKLEKNMEKALEEYKELKKKNPEAYIKKGQNYEMRLTLTKVRIKFRMIQWELQEAQLLRKRSVNAIDQPEATEAPQGTEMTGEEVARIMEDLDMTANQPPEDEGREEGQE